MKHRRILLQVSAALIMVAALVACRGNRSESPPIHLQQNMDFQKRFDAQEENRLFKDRRAMRPQVKGTLAVGELRASDAYYRGTRGGRKVTKIPVRVTEDLLARGKERFNVYCAYCHGHSGDGKGIMLTRKIKVPPTSYMEPRLQSEPIGHFFQVITKGIRNMRGLGSQISARDRWAIAAYVRALQIAGGARIPLDEARQKGWVK